MPEPLDVHCCMRELIAMFGPHHALEDHQALFSRVTGKHRGLGRLSKALGVPIAFHLIEPGQTHAFENGRQFTAGADGRWLEAVL